MRFSATSCFRHLPLLGLSSLIACGGGGSSAQPASEATATPTRASQAGTSIALEGCVVDHEFVPRERSVRALRGDGRLIGSAVANANGIFLLRVPPNALVRLELEGHEEGALTLLTGGGSLSVGACLIDFTV